MLYTPLASTLSRLFFLLLFIEIAAILSLVLVRLAYISNMYSITHMYISIFTPFSIYHIMHCIIYDTVHF